MPESISEVREKMPVFSLGLTIYSAVKWWDLWTLTARMEISDHALWNHKMG